MITKLMETQTNELHNKVNEKTCITGEKDQHWDFVFS